MWQYGGQVWRCTDATAQAAVWSQMTVSGLPGDQTGALFAGGCLRLVTGYTGNLIDITTTVSGAPHTTTIGQDAAGKLDRSALVQALSGADSGTFATIAKVYNQVSGQAPDMTVSPAGPRVGVVRVGGFDMMTWGDNNGPAGLALAGFSVPANQINLGLLGRFHSTNQASGIPPMIVSFGDAGNGPATIRVSMYSGWTGRITRYDTYRGYSDPVPFSFNAQPSANIVSIADSTTYLASGRDFLDSGKLSTGSPMVSLSIGYVPGDGSKDSGLAYLQQATADMHLSGIVLWKQAATVDSVNSLRACCDAAMGYAPQTRGELVILGDSRTQGANTGDGGSWPSWLTGSLANFNRHNFAVSGATTSNMLNALPQAIAQGRSNETKIAVIWCGINDGTGNVSATIGNLQSMVSQLQAAGFRVGVVDEFIGQNNSNQTLRNAIKTALAAGVITADIEIDPFSPGLPLSDQTQAAYWNANDHIHPNTDAGRLLGMFISERLSALAIGA